jgi:hypothetical protein
VTRADKTSQEPGLRNRIAHSYHRAIPVAKSTSSANPTNIEYEDERTHTIRRYQSPTTLDNFKCFHQPYFTKWTNMQESLWNGRTRGGSGKNSRPELTGCNLTPGSGNTWKPERYSACWCQEDREIDTGLPDNKRPAKEWNATGSHTIRQSR